MPNAGVPQEFNVRVEQFDHAVYVFMTAGYEDGLVQPQIEEIYTDGVGRFQVDLVFDRERTTGRPQAALVWTSLGNPPPGPVTLYVKEARSGTLLKTVNFDRTLLPPLADNGTATLRMRQFIDTFPINWVSNDIAADTRLYIPTTFGHDPEGADLFWPVYATLRLTAKEQPLTNLTANMISNVAGLTITPVGPQSRASLLPGETFEAKYRLEGSGILVGLHNLDYVMSYQEGGNPVSIPGLAPIAAMSVGTTHASGLDVQLVSEVPWPHQPGTFHVHTRAWQPLPFLGDEAQVFSFWEEEIPDFDQPPGYIGPVSPVGAEDNAVGPAPVAAASVGNAVIGGATSAISSAAQGKDIEVKDVLVNAAFSGVASDLLCAVAVGSAVIKGAKAVVSGLKNLFGCPNFYFHGETMAIEAWEFRSEYFVLTFPDETQLDVVAVGWGDPVPGSPNGTNIQTTQALPR